MSETFANVCPSCGSADLYAGFGLAGGGYGPYVICDGCGHFDKSYVERSALEEAVWSLCVGLSRIGVAS